MLIDADCAKADVVDFVQMMRLVTSAHSAQVDAAEMLANEMVANGLQSGDEFIQDILARSSRDDLIETVLGFTLRSEATMKFLVEAMDLFDKHYENSPHRPKMTEYGLSIPPRRQTPNLRLVVDNTDDDQPA